MRRFITVGITVALVVGWTAALPTTTFASPPPSPQQPPQMTINVQRAVIVARGAAVNVTVSVTCPDLSTYGDGYEYSNSSDGDNGQAGGFVQVQLTQASGRKLANGFGSQFFNPDKNNPFNPGICDGVWTFDSNLGQWVETATPSPLTVEVFANTFNGGAPFKAGTALIAQGSGGQVCGEVVQGGGNNQGPQCDNFDPFDGTTGDPSSGGQMPSQVIKISSR